jgi:hypothetical protein
MTKETVSHNLYLKISELLQTARQTVARNVNQTMVHTYFEIGRMIVEDEKKGTCKKNSLQNGTPSMGAPVRKNRDYQESPG